MCCKNNDVAPVIKHRHVQHARVIFLGWLGTLCVPNVFIFVKRKNFQKKENIALLPPKEKEKTKFT